MKFILKEASNSPIEAAGPKYILTEATDTAVATSWANWLDKNFEAFEDNLAKIQSRASVTKNREKLSKELKNLDSKIKEINNSQNLKSSISSVEELTSWIADFRQGILEYLKATKIVINAAKKFNPKWYGIDTGKREDMLETIEKLSNLINNESSFMVATPAENTKFKIDQKLNNLIEKIFKIFESLSHTEAATSVVQVLKIVDDPTEATNLEELKRECTETQDNFPSLRKNLFRSEKEYVGVAADQINTYAKAVMIIGQNCNEINQKLAKTSTINKDVTTFLISALKNINKNLEVIEGTQFVVNKKVDWTQMYQKALDATDPYKMRHFRQGDPNSQNELLKVGYYKAVWGEYSEIVRSLEHSLEDECIQYGWTEQTNPYIAFLKRAIRIFKLQNVTDDSYAAIHDSFENQYISEADLRITSKCTFGREDIIFNPELYTHPYNQIIEYIKLRYTLKNAKAKLPAKLKKLAESGPQGFATILNNLFLENGNTENLGAKIEAVGHLRSVQKIKELFTVLKVETETPTSTESSSEPIDSSEIEKAVASAVVTPDLAKKALAYLVDYWRTKFSAEISEINKFSLGKLIANRNTYYPDYDEVETIMSTLNLNKTFKSTEAETLLRALCKKAGIKVESIE